MAEVMTTCARCSGVFTATRGDASYCSTRCRVAAFRAREADRSRAVAVLLARTAQAVRSGAPRNVLDALAADAERLLGSSR